MNNKQIERIITAGKEYIDRGFPVIPVIGKVPRIPWTEFQSRVPSKEEFETMVRSHRPEPTGLAIITGKVSGISVVDVDSEEAEQKIHLPKTPTVKSSKGYHHYFKYPKDGMGNSVRIIEGVDIRADKGYIVAPPSIHESGIEYQWITDLNTEMADFPTAMFETKRPKAEWETIIDGVKEGERHNNLLRIIGKFLSFTPETEWSELVWPTVKLINQNNIPPLPHKELETTYTSIVKKELASRESQTPTLPTVNILSIRELFGKADGGRKFLIEKLLPESGINILSGHPGAGKSWVMLEMAKAVATGTKFLGQFDVIQSPVLIVDGESGESELSTRMKRLGFSENLPVYIASQQGIKVDNEKTMKSLMPKIKELGIKFLILDPFSAIHTKAENSADEMQKVMEGLETFTKAGITVLFIHHHRKDFEGRSSSSAQNLRGSSVILSRVDSMSTITKQEEGKSFIRIICAQEKIRTGKKQQPFELSIEEYESGMGIKYVGGVEAEETKLEIAMGKISFLLESTGKTRKEICEVMKGYDIQGRTTSQAIRILEKHKAIKKEKAGKENYYTLIQKNSIETAQMPLPEEESLI